MKHLKTFENFEITEKDKKDLLNNPVIVFHGQPPLYDNKGNRTEPVEFSKFENRGRFLRGDKTGFYFTPIKELAIDYAEGGNVYTCKLHIKNPYYFDYRIEHNLITSSQMVSLKDRDKLYTHGYDAVIMSHGNKIQEIVVFYNEQIEILNIEKCKDI